MLEPVWAIASPVSLDVDAPRDAVWAVLADGWSYPLWVVGATHMREVDDHWPAVGARLHHSVGVWPLTLEDKTEVDEVRPGRRLVLRARAWPAGQARVEIELTAAPGGGTRVTMAEHAVTGPGKLIPDRAQHALVRPRNAESLQRLRSIAEHREPHGGEATADPSAQR